ncbi:hypothetical protein L596_000221 [Steinernema carpocapsae]|uniref:RecF/RecN/SMC N-terminal domain-containing protein n=1 Tax=Steinernema carpocapsae TaxID=34508 RepID=A0A4V6YSS4_STECR|nr:hypothetical protein L596_000221 [Steinernema carpocapsae]
MGFLQSIEICNLKSYKDVQLFGPFDATKILSIIGENGEGKSNFTDAIAFVFGDKTGSLRARHLRMSLRLSFSDKSSFCRIYALEVVCSLDTGEEVVFERAIVNQGRNYQFSIGGEVVPQKTYSERLYELGIDGGAQNFIVQQGAVDKLGIMNPNLRTEFFAKLSRSIEFKKDYDALMKQIEAKVGEQFEVSLVRLGQEGREAFQGGGEGSFLRGPNEKFYAFFHYISEGIALCDHAAEAQHLAASEADLKQVVTIDGFLLSNHSVSTFGKALKSSALIAWQGSSEEEIIPERADLEEKMTKTNHKIAELKKQAEALTTALAEFKVMRDFESKSAVALASKVDGVQRSVTFFKEKLAEAHASHSLLVVDCAEKKHRIEAMRADQAVSSANLYSELIAEMEISHQRIRNRAEVDNVKKQLKAEIAPEMERSRQITAALPNLEAELRAVKLEKAKESSQAKHEQAERREKMIREKDRLVLKHEELLSKAAQEGMKLPFVRAELEENADVIRFDLAAANQVRPKSTSLQNLPKGNETYSTRRTDQPKEKLDAFKKRLKKVKVPEMDDTADLEAAEANLASLEKLVKAIKKESQEIESKFVAVREQRKRRFEEFFKCVNEHVLKLYKVVTADESAYAQLALEDVNEPFAGGIHYACILPSKAATMFEMMSSGEQTLASLALSLAIHATSKTPLLILDEFDAALGVHNTDRVYSFLRSTVTEGIQIFVISHRYVFLYRAEHALGLYANNDDDVGEGDGVRRSTKKLSFDATGFEDNDVRTEFAKNRGNQDWSQIQFDRDGYVSARSMGSLSSLSSLSSFNLNVRP